MKRIAYFKRKVVLVVIPLLLYVMHFFVKTDDQLVLFSSFNGKGYLDNPKAIFEAMQSNPEHKNYQLVWGMKKLEHIKGAKVVKQRSLAYFYYLVKAKYWVFNAKMPEYYVKKDDQIYLQTWHGTPLKRLAHDMTDTGITYYRSQQSYQQMLASYDKDSQLWDYLVSPNSFSTEVFSSAFQVPKEKLIETGYPRNDVLSQADDKSKKDIREKYRMPQEKTVILYAPTWRDNDYGLTGYTFKLEVDFHKWQKQLGDGYLIVFKPHYLISNQFEIPSDLTEFVQTLPADSDINDAYLMSDMLITDYSSVFFDYANLKQPIYFYMYDMAAYQDELRGFYLDVPSDLPNDISQTEDDLLTKITTEKFDYERLAAFNQRFNQLQDGKASEKVIKEVFR
nr:CDP-glycerol glycerophosphotransferase family protein [Lactococcus insecticola]